jgi:histidinol phosphatase-like enzyme
MKTICFDLDGVICSQTEGDYSTAVPDREAIELINWLYEKGSRIVIYTSRFMGRNNSDVLKTHKEGYDFTVKQLKGWGVKFHELAMGKPRYDIVVDYKALFYRADWKGIKKEMERRL